MTGPNEPIAGLTFDLRTRVETIDDDLAEALGYRSDEVIGLPVSHLVALDAMADIGADLIALVDTGRHTATGVHEMRRRDGSGVSALVSLAKRTDPSGSLTGFAASVLLEPDPHGLSHRLALTVLGANEALFRSMTESSPVGMARLAPDHTITYMNPAFAELADASTTPGTRLVDLIHPDDRARVASALTRAGDQASSDGQVQCRLGNSTGARWATLRFASVSDDELGTIATTVTADPVTGLQADESETGRSELAYLATHDSLTGLPNRGLLLDHLQLALARSARDGRPIAVLFMDLDRFKAVNDTHGHDAGDRLLRDVAERIARVLRPSDTVARLGGDEFVVLCEDIDGEVDAMTIATRVRDSVAPETLLVDGVPADVSLSIGVALASGSADTAETLLKQADAAMYRAKRSGRGRIELFDEVLRRRNQRRQELRRHLEKALEDRTIAVHYQPVVDLTSGRVRSVEALVRWQHPQGGPLSAGDLVDLAVSSGLDTRLDGYVLSIACHDARRWLTRHGEKTPRLHVNVTGRSVSSGRIVAELERNLAVSAIPAAKLCIEMSERLLMVDVEGYTERLERIHELGVAIAIDDVGSGATSLPKLRGLHLDVLKVDGSLTADMLRDPVSRRLVGAAVAVGRALGLTVAAEAIEHRDAIPILRQLGTHLAQGRVFSPPLPAERVSKLFDMRSTLVEPRGDQALDDQALESNG